MLTDEQRAAFEQWYAENAFDFTANPIGSRDCGLQRDAFAAGIAYAQTWRSMESAPQTNGEPLLVQTLSGVPMLVTRDDACWYDWHTNRQLDEAHFTGWLPLPPTDAAKEAGNGS